MLWLVNYNGIISNDTVVMDVIVREGKAHILDTVDMSVVTMEAKELVRLVKEDGLEVYNVHNHSGDSLELSSTCTFSSLDYVSSKDKSFEYYKEDNKVIVNGVEYRFSFVSYDTGKDTLMINGEELISLVPCEENLSEEDKRRYEDSAAVDVDYRQSILEFEVRYAFKFGAGYIVHIAVVEYDVFTYPVTLVFSKNGVLEEAFYMGSNQERIVIPEKYSGSFCAKYKLLFNGRY